MSIWGQFDADRQHVGDDLRGDFVKADQQYPITRAQAAAAKLAPRLVFEVSGEPEMRVLPPRR